jgi:hypothetical protein
MLMVSRVLVDGAADIHGGGPHLAPADIGVQRLRQHLQYRERFGGSHPDHRTSYIDTSNQD